MGWAIDQHYHIAGILVDVHSVHLWNTEVLQPPFPRSGPNGQPVESSQLTAVSRPRNRHRACFTFGQDQAHLGVEPRKGAETLNAHRY